MWIYQVLGMSSSIIQFMFDKIEISLNYIIINAMLMHVSIQYWLPSAFINPFRTKTPKYLFPRGNEPLLYHCLVVPVSLECIHNLLFTFLSLRFIYSFNIFICRYICLTVYFIVHVYYIICYIVLSQLCFIF